jgi:hypothetical protein
MIRSSPPWLLLVLGLSLLFGNAACTKGSTDGSGGTVSTAGTVEVTAKLVEIRGELPNIPLYDYAFVFKYEVLKVHRGSVAPKVIYVAHYNPLKSRTAAADARSGAIGGDVEVFRAGDVHRMALNFPIDDHFMGGVVNRYFEEGVRDIHWAVWTNPVANARSK